ncbi:hypothetical protein N8837_01080 [Pseudomonadales bacterium]|nr:hypothetical protein [Pseudomonadales bacterium]
MSQLKKSALILLALSIVFMLYTIGRLKFNFTLLLFGLGGLGLLTLILRSYYGHTDLLLISLFDRIFLESIQSTSVFYDTYIDNAPMGLNYLPSEGAGLWGLEGVALEREIFYEQFSNRVGRYGNSPVLSFTYGYIALGYFVIPYLLTVYTLIFVLSREVHKRLASFRFIVLNAGLMVFYLPLFLSGGFKVVSLFIFYPLTLMLAIGAINTLSKEYVLKKD